MMFAEQAGGEDLVVDNEAKVPAVVEHHRDGADPQVREEAAHAGEGAGAIG
jgi:hypothetical protein